MVPFARKSSGAALLALHRWTAGHRRSQHRYERSRISHSTARLVVQVQQFLDAHIYVSFLRLLAEVRFAEPDGHLVNLAGELVIALLVVVGHKRVEVLAHVRRFRAKRVRLSVLDPSSGDLLIVDEDRTVTSRARLTSVVSKFEA